MASRPRRGADAQTPEYVSVRWPDECLRSGLWQWGLLQQVISAGHTGVGVEPDPQARELARARRLKVYDGTAESLPDELSARSFDAVVMTHVLEHCIDPGRAVANASQLLRDGGLLVVETPNNSALGLGSSGAAWNWLDVPRHLVFFTPRSLRAVVSAAGLQVRSTEYYGYTRQFSSAWIDNEQRIWDRFATRGAADSMPSRPSRIRAWEPLMRTMLALPSRKYDSVRVIAFKPGGSASES